MKFISHILHEKEHEENVHQSQLFTSIVVLSYEGTWISGRVLLQMVRLAIIKIDEHGLGGGICKGVGLFFYTSI